MAEIVQVKTKSLGESKLAWLSGLVGLSGIFDILNLPGIVDALNYVVGSGTLPTHTAAILTTIAGVLGVLVRKRMPDIKK